MLHQEVKTFLDDAIVRQWRGVPHAAHQTLDKEHGRHEQRRYWITEQIDWLADKAQWEGLRSVAVVESVRLAGAVRGHWEVENCVHWVLDVQLGEDAHGLRQRHAVQNLALLRALTLNILRRDKTHAVGVRAKQKAAGWSCAYLQLLHF